MAITAADVKKLRDMTGAGMMDAKKALTEAEGSMERAEEILRVKLGSKAGPPVLVSHLLPLPPPRRPASPPSARRCAVPLRTWTPR